jgi:hypothetical protein
MILTSVTLRAILSPNYNSTKICFAYFGFPLGGTPRKEKPQVHLISDESNQHQAQIAFRQGRKSG